MRLRVPWGSLLAILALPVLVSAQGADQPAPDTPAGEAEALPAWQWRFELGGSSSAGNTETQSLFLSLSGARESTEQRTALDVSYYFAAETGDRTENKLTAGLLQDWYLSESPWLVFAQTRYDLDEFQSWEHRVTAGGGVGLKLIQTEAFDLVLRGGGGVAREFGSQNESLRPEAILGADITWRIRKGQKLTFNNTLFPDLEDTGEFRAITALDWSLQLDEASGLSLSFGVHNEYQSRVDPGVKHNDLKIVAGLVIEF